MSEELKKVISDLQETYRADPKEAQKTFTSESALQEGLRSEVVMRDHSLTVDEPNELGGTDAGPNPVELVLGALGSCQEITYRAYATALGIPLERVSVKLEGEIDLRGFFGVDESVRPGYNAIKGVVRLESSASEEQLELLRTAVNAHCPVLDIITQPVSVELTLETTPSAKEVAAE